ncbi:(deoxy)nucleoside triphosphate pyrophosphohydrolase [Algoriphagus aquimarinus]|uniref:8-oxo-dGTP diphosphatase n=1 Tax=Algoriphagus aquimarinus TaxID=237018 RepID=A0A1I1CG60_9BACT|nr:(deoxy)nucleoside triphosphate pyrophosphohydrolase [Algoriphagus aquimarinus]SFB59433.1 8-oxo-dGTP diphosphatase [Algoriphagus aquimarinus]|tara:strand:+ start:128571 stop:129005 length:435 start_codon:yes stop_codon:yes gene_type:complete
MEVVSVTCALIFLDQKVLCAQRSEAMQLPGLWEFPGGKIEKGESPEDCLIREIKEELAISINIIGSLRSNEHAYSDVKVIRLMPFICVWGSGKLKLVEHQEVKWLAKEELKSLNWAQADIPIVEDLYVNWNNIQEQLVEYNREN